MSGPIEGIDERIIAVLREDARTSNREIARQLNVSEGTIRSHIKRLEEDHQIRIGAVTSMHAMGMLASAFVGLFVERDKVTQVGEALAQLPSVRFVAVTFGRYDMVASVVLETREQLLHVLSEDIPSIPGVRRTETAEALRAFKHDYTRATLQ